MNSGLNSKGIRTGVLKRFITKEVILIFGIVVIGGIFGAIQPVFLSTTNLFNIMRAISALGIVSLGVGLVMMLGEIDFSVGALVGLGGGMAGVLIERVGINNWTVLAITLVVGAIAGIINGLVVVKVKIPSFLATLGTSMIFSTIALVITGAIPIQRFRPAMFFNFFAGKIGPFVRIEVLWLIFLSIIFFIVLNRTYFGYYVYAVGGNTQAAKLSGIKTDNIKIVAYLISGVLASFVGIISMSHMKMASPNTGEGMQLYAIAAVIMGGVRLSGGVGSVPGILLGVILMGILNNGLIVTGLPAFYHGGFVGLILILSIMAQVSLTEKNK
jgi:ribose/xylose/arabinose/galactoside ABC-type transport system permease subunit